HAARAPESFVHTGWTCTFGGAGGPTFQRRLLRAVRVPERFRGGFAPSAPSRARTLPHGINDYPRQLTRSNRSPGVAGFATRGQLVLGDGLHHTTVGPFGGELVNGAVDLVHG